MMYKKAVVEIVKFDDFDEFMTGSLIGGHCDDYIDSVGQHCIGYDQGSLCEVWTTPWDGGICNSFRGRKCYDYYDNTHNPNPCTEYGFSCKIF